MADSDQHTGLRGFAFDSAILAGVIASGQAGVAFRITELVAVAKGGKTVHPDSRLGAFKATLGYCPRTVGDAVNNAIAILYVALGTYGEERIGTVFSSPAAKRLYPDSVQSDSSRQVARMEYDYWSRVKKEDPWSSGSTIATAFDPKTRDWLQKMVFGRDYGLSASECQNRSLPTPIS